MKYENICSKGGDAHDLTTNYSQVNGICFIFRIIFSTEEPKKSESRRKERCYNG